MLKLHECTEHEAMALKFYTHASGTMLTTEHSFLNDFTKAKVKAKIKAKVKAKVKAKAKVKVKNSGGGGHAPLQSF